MAEHEELDSCKQALTDALKVLNERERRIFEARQLADDPMTLEDLAVEFGISRERVRKIEVRAFQKVQRTVQIAITTRPLVALHFSSGRCGPLYLSNPKTILAGAVAPTRRQRCGWGRPPLARRRRSSTPSSTLSTVVWTASMSAGDSRQETSHCCAARRLSH